MLISSNGKPRINRIRINAETLRGRDAASTRISGGLLCASPSQRLCAMITDDVR